MGQTEAHPLGWGHPSSSSAETINDGQFHTVELVTFDQMVNLSIDGGSPMTMDNFGKHYTLNSEAPLYVGGEDCPAPGLSIGVGNIAGGRGGASDCQAAGGLCSLARSQAATQPPLMKEEKCLSWDGGLTQAGRGLWGVLEFPRLPSTPWASFFSALGQKGLVQCSGSIPSLGPSEAQSCCWRPGPRSRHEVGLAQLAFRASQLTGPVHQLRTFPGPESRFPEAVGSSQHCAGPGLESGQVGGMENLRLVVVQLRASQ